MGKKFSIYCSGGASRVLKFYTYRGNICKFRPEKVIFDGSNLDVVESLTKLFQDDLIWIDSDKLNPQELKRIHSYTSSKIHDWMNKSNSDYLFCFGEKILKKPFIEEYKDRLINFHPSLLPAFKGIKSIDQAINSNVSVIGNTAHFINQEIDEGRVLLQTAMLTQDFNEYEDVLELQLPMLKLILRDLLDFNVSNECLFSDIRNRKKSYLIPTSINIKIK